ncbi:flagellar FlbD family protein [Vagococcus silagei]|uniref:Flagellar protein FlbD n=1 Tax=Vagococcus silagei TaxID=2508885 RepID=A0A4S3B6W7_9ENTE|nr:flagellar FlbD family protein [Vagococcus silagei]THB61336.1 hypothetical protein ESZ54_06190 [Vagococcus silagei]
MIKLTLLNGIKIYLNTSVVRTLEASPDSIITLVDGKTIIVKESPEEIVDLFKEYHQSIGLIGL